LALCCFLVVCSGLGGNAEAEFDFLDVSFCHFIRAGAALKLDNYREYLVVKIVVDAMIINIIGRFRVEIFFFIRKFIREKLRILVYNWIRCFFNFATCLNHVENFFA